MRHSPAAKVFLDHENEGGTTGEALAEKFESDFREAMSHLPSGVTIVALRENSRVHATTVSSFIPVTVDPPRVLVSVGGNAQVLPFLEAGASFTVNVLGADQRRLASVYADSFPVGPSPFPAEGPPVIAGALASLVCDVTRVIEIDATRLTVGRVTRIFLRGGPGALVHFRRAYHEVPKDSSGIE